MGLAQGVAPHRTGGRCSDEILPDLPLRIGMVSRFVIHEGGEALVQPEIVPPFHRDQISEPHVSNLMGDDMSYRFLCPDARILVHVQENFSISYGSPLLRWKIREFRDG